MKPNPKLVRISNNVKQIKTFLDELVLQPRLKAMKWALITKQTPNIKIGYTGQHLASLITGVEGERTGARGNDLCDGSEVKSCSRIDALDQCAERECGAAVARMETVCPVCNSANIFRSNDSKWLFTIRSEEELKLLTSGIVRVEWTPYTRHGFSFRRIMRTIWESTSTRRPRAYCSPTSRTA